MIYLGLAASADAQATSRARGELIKIALKDDYRLTLQFNQHPRYAFDLWLPEVAIFNADLDRSTVAEPIDGVWLAKRQGNLQVRGRLKTGNRKMDFQCTLNPQTASTLMLELEIKNTGKTDWNNYTQLAICLAPAENNPAFSDSSGDRTFINLPDTGVKPITVAGTVGSYNHYPVGELDDPDDSIQRAHIADGFVARKSTDGKTTISFMWESSARVDVNPGGLDCIHSHPATGPLKAGESITLKGYIMIHEGSPENHYISLRELMKPNQGSYRSENHR